MNDRLLRVTAILSILALVGITVAVGGAAAQADFDIEEVDVVPVSPYNDTVDVSITVNNTGTSSGTANVTFAANETSPVGPGSAVTGPSYTTPTLNVGETDTTTITLNTGNASDGGDYGTLTNATAINDIFHGAFVNNTATGTVNDNATLPFVVGIEPDDRNERGAVTAQVRDTNQFPIQDANVTLFLVRSGQSDIPIAEDVVADGGPDGNTIRFSNVSPTKPASDVSLAIGPNANNAVEYKVRAEKQGFDAANRSVELHLDSPERTVFPELTPLVTPDEINVIQNNPTRQDDAIARADGREKINFNITVFGSDPTQPPSSQIVNDAEVLLDVEGLAEANVTVINEDTGNTFSGDQFNLSQTDAPLPFSTGGDGKLNLSVTSERVQDVFFTFTTVREKNNITITGNGPTGLAVNNPRVKSFFLDGEGQVIGDVWDASLSPGFSPEHSLSNARVWAHRKSRVTDQGIRVPPASNGSIPFGFNVEGFADAGDESFFRVVKTEDDSLFTPSNDTVIDVTQDYRIDNNGQSVNLSISRVRELDQNDSTVGSGFAVRANTDNPCAVNEASGQCEGTGMFVTPLEPGYYYVQQSNNQANASDVRFIDSGQANDPFPQLGSGGYLIDGRSSFNPNNFSSPTRGPVFRGGNLTFAAAKQRSAQSGQKLWDLTDRNGEYVLQDMYTNFQAGIDYTLFANKAGYEIEFVDAFVTESGAFFENGEDENFGLERVEEDIEVNVTNIARLDSIDDAPADPDDPNAYDQYEYNNKSDNFSQQVPRDGRTIDVVQVDTQTESGAPVNGTIELSVPDLGGTTLENNFTGNWIEVAGGTVLSQDDRNNTITIATGSDGQAIAWLRTDLSGEDLNSVFEDNVNTGGLVCEVARQDGELVGIFSGIIAQSPTDAGVVDATCKDFTATVVLQTAELSGVTSNQNNDPVEATVYTGTLNLNAAAPNGPAPAIFDFRNRRIEVIRNSRTAATGNSTYTVRHVYDNVSLLTNTVVNTVVLGNETGLTAGDLSRYEAFGTNQFPNIAVAGEGRNGFTLLTNSSEVINPVRERSTYTLPDVPAENGPPAGDDTQVTPTGFDEAIPPNFGTAVSEGLQINRTQTANIEITSLTNFTVLSVDAPTTVNQGDQINVSATIRNQGGVTASGSVAYSLRNNTGVEVRTDTDTVVLGGAENGTVNFSVDSTGLALGNFTNNVTTADDPVGETAPTEVVLGAAPANYEVSNLVPEEATVTEGSGSINISADINNTGGVAGNQDIDLTVENSSGVVFSDTTAGVQLNAGQNTTVTFTGVPAGALSPGEYNHSVSSDDDTIEGNLTVQEAPEFLLSNASATPDPATRGENVTLSADVENVGGPGTQGIQFNVNGTSASTGKLDVAFLIDRSGSMSDEIADVRDATQDFAATVSQSADARFGIVTYANGFSGPDVAVNQTFTSDVGQTETSLAQIANSTPGSLELNYDAINQTIRNDSVLSPRPDAKLVLIDLTDEDTDIRQNLSTGEILTPNGTVIKDVIESNDVSFFGVTPTPRSDLSTGGDLNEPSFPYAGYKKWLAQNVSDGKFFDLDASNLSQKFENEIAQAVANESGGQPLTLNASETKTVEFEVNTSNFAPGTFDFNVTSPDDDAGGSFVVEAPPTADFEVSNLVPADANVTEGSGSINISADVDNVGNASGTQDINLTVENSSGVVFSDTAAGVQLGAGANTTVEFTGVPAGTLAPGDYNHIVSSANDSVVGNLTIESSNPVDQYRDQNGDVNTGGLQDAIDDFLNNNIGTGVLQDVIDAFLNT